MRQFIFYLLIITSSTTSLLGQDIRGAEIKCFWSGATPTEYNYTFTVLLYCQSNLGLDRDTIIFNNQILSGTSSQVQSNITEWKYDLNHTFAGTGTYPLNFEEQYRIANIQNIINSAAENLSLESLLIINPFFPQNSCPIFLNNQTELIKVGNTLVHEPNAIDPDGDSLVYSLVTPNTTNYSMPPNISIDSRTGRVEIPFSLNIYAIKICLKEFRSGSLASTSYREMVIDGSALTSVNEINSNEPVFSLFPNPVSQLLKINFKQEINSSEIKIFDNLGKEVLSKHNNNIELDIDVSILSSGIYYIQAEVEGTLSRQKFIKQ